MSRFRMFDWFFSKEEKEYYVSPLELLEDRIEIMEKDHLDIINRFFELEKRVDELEQCTKN